MPPNIDDIIRRLRTGFLGECLTRALEMDAVARAIALASQAFTAGIPFIIVLSAVGPGNRDFAQRLIKRFHITGATADQIRTLFLPHAEVRRAVTGISVVFLIASLLSLAGSLQIIYERTFGVAHVGLRARWRALTWLVGTGFYIGWFVELRPNLYDGGANIWRLALALVGSYIYWGWSPRILIGPALSTRRILPVAALTSTGVLILSIVSPLYMPQMITTNASRFGTIGVVFALLSWLVALAFLVVGSAVIASQIDRDAGWSGPAPARDEPG